MAPQELIYFVAQATELQLTCLRHASSVPRDDQDIIFCEPVVYGPTCVQAKSQNFFSTDGATGINLLRSPKICCCLRAKFSYLFNSI